MFPLRNVLGRGNAAASTGRTALQAVATRAHDATGLEREQWVAADVDDGSSSPMFSEPLTIDELRAAKDDFEASFHSASAQGAPALLTEDGASESASSVDADQQMQTIHQTAVYSRSATSEYLDAALQVAADDDVQCALMTALMKNPDAQAALQRGLAMQGLSIDMQRLQARASLLPAAAAAILPAGSAARAGVQVTEVTEENPAQEGGALQSGNPLNLKDALEAITTEVIEKLAMFGGHVQMVLHGVMRRWKRRIHGLLNPGRERIPGRGEQADEGRAVGIVDSILSAAALIVTIALFKRIPGMRS